MGDRGTGIIERPDLDSPDCRNYPPFLIYSDNGVAPGEWYQYRIVAITRTSVADQEKSKRSDYFRVGTLAQEGGSPGTTDIPPGDPVAFYREGPIGNRVESYGVSECGGISKEDLRIPVAIEVEEDGRRVVREPLPNRRVKYNAVKCFSYQTNSALYPKCDMPLKDTWNTSGDTWYWEWISNGGYRHRFAWVCLLMDKEEDEDCGPCEEWGLRRVYSGPYNP